MSVRPKPLVHADRLLARSVFWLVFAVTAALFGGPPGDSDLDGELLHQATRALALGDGLLITGDVPESAALLESGELVRSVQGGGVALVEPVLAATGVPLHLLGVQLAGLFPGVERVHADTAPGFASGRSEYWSHLLVALRGPLFIALAAWASCLAALRLGARRATAWLGALALALTTCLLPASAAFSAQAQVAATTAGSLYMLLLVRDGFYRLSAPSAWHWALLGALLSATVATQPSTALAALLLAISAVRMSLRGRERLWSMPQLKGGAGAKRSIVDIAWFALPMILVAAIWMWGVLVREGRFDASAALPLLPIDQWPRELLGIVASPGKGLVWLAPLLVLAPFGYSKFLKEPRLATFTLWAPLAALIAAAATGSWSDLGEFGPTGTAATIVLAWPAVLVGFDVVRSQPPLRVMALALGACGLLANLGGVLTSRGAWRDVVVAAAPELYPNGPTPPSDEFNRRVAFDWRTAAPWFSWRAVRHRTAAAKGEFSADVFPSFNLLLVADAGPYSVRAPRDRGFSHLAWVDFEQRLDGHLWPVILLLSCAAAVGTVLAVKALDPTRP